MRLEAVSISIHSIHPLKESRLDFKPIQPDKRIA